MLGWVLGISASAAAAGAGLWWWLFRAPLPKVEGTLEADGLAAPVEIRRDEWGVPHVEAKSLGDSLFGLGYVHAQDRLWQMEFQRRIGAGRLSEAFGERAVEADRFLRRFGFRRAAEAELAQVPADERALVEAYCRGVNAAIAAMGSRLPLEFRLLGIKPEPWEPVDSLAWGKLMSFFLAHNWEDEIVRHRLVQKLGPEAAARLETFYAPGYPLTTDPGGPGAADSADEILRLLHSVKPFLPVGGPGASNNWVVSGSRTATGKPLLANDPHLALHLPSFWYEAHLSSPECDVTGVTLAGVPGVIIGHNRHVAWGYTDSYADASDLFIEKWHPTEAATEFMGVWEPVKVVQETIRVKGKPDVVETVYVTRHGPLLAGGPLGKGAPLSMRWTGHEPGHILRAVVGMNTARNAKEFRDSLRWWSAPSLNMVFADVEGNIGYLMAGLLPIRRSGTGLTPVPGWTGGYEWRGWIPFDELPQLWNPPSGFICTANNKVVDHTYKHHVTWDYMPGYRAQRIQEVISSKAVFTPEDCRKLQVDVRCIPGLELARHCRGLKPTDPLEQRALEALVSWDGDLTPDTVGGSVYEALLHHALRLAYRPIMGDEILDLWLGKGHVLMPANTRAGRAVQVLLRELKARDPKFFDIGRPPGAAKNPKPDPWEDLLARALTAAVADLRERRGPDPSKWTWGELHRLRIQHPLAAVKPLQLLFPGRDVPFGGDTATPLQTGHVPTEPYEATAWAPAFRMVVDLADMNAGQSCYPGGQSGHPGSRNYMDQFSLYLANRFHPMLFSAEDVRAKAKATLRLVPPTPQSTNP